VASLVFFSIDISLAVVVTDWALPGLVASLAVVVNDWALPGLFSPSCRLIFVLFSVTNVLVAMFCFQLPTF
jgi:hypothetical protein